jgi:hypothetical protein
MDGMILFLLGISTTLNIICLYLLKIIYDRLAGFKISEAKIVSEQCKCINGNVGETKTIKNEGENTTVKMSPENNKDIADLIGKPTRSVVQFGKEG